MFEWYSYRLEDFHPNPWIKLFSKDVHIRKLSYFLRMALQSSATDARDHVFAITSVLPQYLRCLIPIDYGANLQSILIDAVTACIVECQHLNILRYCELPKGADRSNASGFRMEHFESWLDNNLAVDYSSGQLHESLASAIKSWRPNVSVTCRTRECSQATAKRWQRYGGMHNSSVCDGFCELQMDRKIEGRLIIERLPGPVPPGQILPRLRVRVHFLDICLGTHYNMTNNELYYARQSSWDSDSSLVTQCLSWLAAPLLVHTMVRNRPSRGWTPCSCMKT